MMATREADGILGKTIVVDRSFTIGIETNQNLKEMSDVSGAFLELLSPCFSGNPQESNFDDIQKFKWHQLTALEHKIYSAYLAIAMAGTCSSVFLGTHLE